MRIAKLHYVFSFIFILIFNLHQSGFAQQKGTIQKGSATWYGSKYHGKITSSGEVYNKGHMTAAHPTLPFGTKVKVTNAVTKQSVIVRINDRGPFGKKGCIIDLSEAAARKIELYRYGYGKVIVQVLPSAVDQTAKENQNSLTMRSLPSDSSQILTSQQFFVVQAGSYTNLTNAQLQSNKLRSFDQCLDVILNEENVQGKKIHRVEAGHFSSRSEAEAFKSELQKNGILVLVKQVPSAS